MLRDLLERLRYFVYLRIMAGGITPYLMVAIVALVIIGLGMNAAFVGLFSPPALRADGIAADIDAGFFDALWWSAKHVLDPGAFSEDYGAPAGVVLIALFNSIMGLAILGVLIAYITNFIQRRLEMIRKGGTVIKETGHTVVLGWSREAIFILRQLAGLSKKRTVVVLAPRDVDEVENAIRMEGRALKNLRVLAQNGLTTSRHELERVAIDKASSVITLSHVDDESGDRDIASIKTMMLLSSIAWPGGKPNLVVEIAEKKNFEIAQVAGGKGFPVISSSEIVSKTIVQSARQRGFATLYEEIFAFSGNIITLQEPEGLEGCLFRDVAHWYPDAVPLGVSWINGTGVDRRQVAALNPEPDYDFGEGEALILLSRNAEPQYDRGVGSPIAFDCADASFSRARLSRILILGWNQNIDEILNEFEDHANDNSIVTIVSNHGEQYAREYMEANREKRFKNISCEYVQANTVNRNVLRPLDILSYDAVIVLADESHQGDDPDSRTILTLLQLKDIRQQQTGMPFPPVVVEIYDSRNRGLLEKTPATEIVVSPEIVSMQISQVSMRPVLASIYRELLSAGGIEICYRPASRYVHPGHECTFGQIATAAQQYGEVAFGTKTGASGIMLNPGKSHRLVLERDDTVVVLAQQVYN